MHHTLNQQYLDYVNSVIAGSYHGHTLESALRSAMWFNVMASGERPELHQPQPVTVYWSGMDNRERYLSHLADPRLRQQLVEQGWLDSEIKYTLNSWGFRSDSEYDTVTEPCVITMGCSFTFGTGLHLEQTWPYLLAQRMGVRLVNLATPGHGLDLNSLWLLLKGSGIANPLAVCVYEPPPGRISWLQQYYSSDTDLRPVYVNTLVNMFESIDPNHIAQANIGSMITDLLLNSSVASVKNFHIISNWCSQRDIPLIWHNSRSNIFSSLARDLAHWGWEWHVNIANWVFNELKG